MAPIQKSESGEHYNDRSQAMYTLSIMLSVVGMLALEKTPDTGESYQETSPMYHPNQRQAPRPI